MSGTVFGLDVVVVNNLPLIPSDAENARRIVRHGLADVLRWLGEQVGPKPFEETHCLISKDDPRNGRASLSVSRELAATLHRECAPHMATELGRAALGEVYKVRHQYLYDGGRL